MPLGKSEIMKIGALKVQVKDVNTRPAACSLRPAACLSTEPKISVSTQTICLINHINFMLPFTTGFSKGVFSSEFSIERHIYCNFMCSIRPTNL